MSWVVVLAGWAGMASAQKAPGASRAAVPGSVVSWPGEGVERCEFQGRSFEPLAGACLLAVDLDAQGTLEATRVRAGKSEKLTLEMARYPYPEQRLKIDDESRVNLSEKDEARAARERERLLPLFDLETSRRFELPLSSPLQTLPAGGRFGSRRVINGQPRSPHSGADYAANRGTPILAVADGTVKLAEEHFFSGNSVFIDHGDGLVSMYFHLNELFVAPGQSVTRGAVIGTVGSTGRSTGPHLHLGLRWHGARVDPGPLMKSPASLQRAGQ